MRQGGSGRKRDRRTRQARGRLSLSPAEPPSLARAAAARSASQGRWCAAQPPAPCALACNTKAQCAQAPVRSGPVR